jgi:hypothetical protein
MGKDRIAEVLSPFLEKEVDQLFLQYLIIFFELSEQVLFPRTLDDLETTQLVTLKTKGMQAYLVIDIGDVHNIKDIIVKVVHENTSDYIQGNIIPIGTCCQMPSACQKCKHQPCMS